MNPDASLDLGLLGIERPARYAGNEYGLIRKDAAERLSIVLSYPDLYEIGMSNQAVRLLYRLFNAVPDVRCERVFAPAPDFEALLRKTRQPLFSLETATPIRMFDIAAFSLGTELNATSMLNVLDLGGIPIRRRARREEDSVVIAGGPALSNPVPFTEILDAVFIGEAEDFAMRDLPVLAALRTSGGRRTAILEYLSAHPNFWTPGAGNRVRKAVFSGFSRGTELERLQGIPELVPHITVAQDHGTVEIMRGCPNSCRYCHASVYYRPFRCRPVELIEAEVDRIVRGSGHRLVSLSSLSSGDYPGILDLFERLNRRYASMGVSFSLPSLKVESFGLDLLSRISEVRKSGLTFAVETPFELDQRSINKIASREKIVQILKDAKAKGWRIAKFYFMAGLPVAGSDQEARSIAEFLVSVHDECRLPLNVNLGTFIPKPHTPYQWSAQLGMEEAEERFRSIRAGVGRRPIKISWHSPRMSYVEGLIARGDERMGEVILKAFEYGTRLDAWEDHFDFSAWERAIAEVLPDGGRCLLEKRPGGSALPWDGMDMGVGREHLVREFQKSERGETTDSCLDADSDGRGSRVRCPEFCGACRDKDEKARIPEPAIPTVSGEERSSSAAEKPESAGVSAEGRVEPATLFSYVFRFRKTGAAVLSSHLDVASVFMRAFYRAGFSVKLTEGFNPQPRLEFANPLPLGVEAWDEPAAVVLTQALAPDDFVARFNAALPEGLALTSAFVRTYRVGEKKPASLMATYAASRILLFVPDAETAQSVRKGVRAANSPFYDVSDPELRPSVDSASVSPGAILATPETEKSERIGAFVSLILRQKGINAFLRDFLDPWLDNGKYWERGMRIVRETVLMTGEEGSPEIR